MSSGADLFVVCKTCGSEVSPYITECPYCGSRLRKRAPKLDKTGQPRERRGLRRSRTRASLGRLRPGEMPGIRVDSRPWATLAFVVAALLTSLAVQTTWVVSADLAVVGPLDGEGWRLVTAPFVYVNTGYALVALLSIGLFGWLLERRYGHLVPGLIFLAGAAAGNAVAVALESFPVSAGGNGGALALLSAWAVPDLLERRRGGETESDLLGAGVIAAALAVLPAVVEEANWLAGAGGVVAGLVLGLLLSAFRRGG
jgi:membrane associated rhomboid family serine protease